MTKCYTNSRYFTYFYFTNVHCSLRFWRRSKLKFYIKWRYMHLADTIWYESQLSPAEKLTAARYTGDIVGRQCRPVWRGPNG